MLLYLDTEFTDLAVHTSLLSIGIVGPTNSGVSFYAEVTDRDRIDGASWFAVENVLPQFGLIPYAACAYAELGSRLCTFLNGLATSLAPGQYLDVAFGYQLDWDLLERAIHDNAGRRCMLTMGRMRPFNVYSLVSPATARMASEASAETGMLSPSSRHHALADAKALRTGFEAATDTSPMKRRTPSPAYTNIGTQIDSHHASMGGAAS